MHLKNSLLICLIISFCFKLFSQNKPIHTYLEDDTLLKKKWIEQVQFVKNDWINKVNPLLKKDFQSIYDIHFKQINEIISSKSSITAKDSYNYLQQIFSVILKANPQLTQEGIRLFFSRDSWPNAYSMGDGTIVINAGLVIHLQNEAELTFVLCHELAHYYNKHTQLAIDNYISHVTSSEMQKKLQTLSKQPYGVNKELEKMALSLVFNSRHHSRNKESEADLQAYTYFVNTGYNAPDILSLLHTLDTIDKAEILPQLNLQSVFNFENYPFKTKWIKNESVIFSQMGNADTDKTTNDTLKTHPDCTVRIAALTDSVNKQKSGKNFLVNESYFKQLKQDLLTEMIEYCYQSNNISRNLYYNLQLLQQQQQVLLASCAIARDMNKIYELRKNHTGGLYIENENRYFPDDYNLLLRMLNRIRLDEITQLTNSFCTKYLSSFHQYDEIKEQINIAEKNSH